MRTERKMVKDFLKSSNKTAVEELARELMLSDEQKGILFSRLEGKSYTEIALNKCCDISTAKRKLAEVYDKIYNIILR